jgi:LPS sulfotransferase NodH
MSARFAYFVMLAEMRTGSNYLEETLNEIPGLRCHGELFNPHFIGKANSTELFGIDLAAREADPLQLLDRARAETEGLAGFRYFHDHDPRILDHCLPDPDCAKIVLTRNPIDSYVSLKLARQTGQWRLRDLKNRREAGAVDFDADEFLDHLDTLQGFQLRLLHGLQTTGQTAFYIGYDDLGDMEVINGLARFLGVDHEKRRATSKTKVQNPAPLEDKVANFPEMAEALARIDRFDLTRTPNFEPRRGPLVPGYVAAAGAPLLYQPVHSGVGAEVADWLARLGPEDRRGLLRDFTQKTLRQWKRRSGPHRSFTVVRHPVPRLYDAFRRHMIETGARPFQEIRQTLLKTYKMPIPKGKPGKDFGPDEMRTGFKAFARFIRGNLSGQTGVRVDGAWASQDMLLQGLAQFALPDMVIRHEALGEGLAQLCAQLGLDCPAPPAGPDPGPIPLEEIYDEELEAEVRAAYQRDYMSFGYGAWR